MRWMYLKQKENAYETKGKAVKMGSIVWDDRKWDNNVEWEH